jgi:N-methylhydantoinase A
VDPGGILHVGPESAGADPGPACYGKGGTGTTVTDANLVLGYLDPANFLGGRRRLFPDAARAAVEKVARQLGMPTVAAADGIHQVVSTNMAEGIRIVSVRRGVDPRRFILLAFGGAAGLHVTAVARRLEIGRVVVPRLAAVLSAWGMLATDLRYELVQTRVGELKAVGAAEIRGLFAEMEEAGRRRLAAAFTGPVSVRRSLDMRYGEQIFEITVPLDGMDLTGGDVMARIVERFHRRHEELYTYSTPEQEVVLVNARVAVVGRLPALPQEPVMPSPAGVARPVRRRVYLGGWMEVPVYDLDGMPPGLEVEGPAIFESATTTVLVRRGEGVLITPHGWLDIRLG